MGSYIFFCFGSSDLKCDLGSAYYSAFGFKIDSRGVPETFGRSHPARSATKQEVDKAEEDTEEKSIER